MHDVDIKDIGITYKYMDFIIIFSGYIIPATPYGSELCFIINLYFYTTFVYDFYAIFIQMTAQHE